MASYTGKSTALHGNARATQGASPRRPKRLPVFVTCTSADAAPASAARGAGGARADSVLDVVLSVYVRRGRLCRILRI